MGEGSGMCKEKEGEAQESWDEGPGPQPEGSQMGPSAQGHKLHYMCK